jgi:hypothetical protein
LFREQVLRNKKKTNFLLHFCSMSSAAQRKEAREAEAARIREEADAENELRKGQAAAKRAREEAVRQGFLGQHFDWSPSAFDVDGARLTLDVHHAQALELLEAELPGTVHLSSSAFKLTDKKDDHGRSFHLVCGGADTDRWRLWVHRQCKADLLKALKRDGGDKVVFFCIGHKHADVFMASPLSCDRSRLIRAIKLSGVRHVMLEWFGGRCPFPDFEKRVRQLKDFAGYIYTIDIGYMLEAWVRCTSGFG